ncbi:MAG TPA: hypothetical protein VF753_03150 [Terriglobales bacterium]
MPPHALKLTRQVISLLAASLLLLAVPAFAANPTSFILQPDKFMVSQPLGEIAKTAPPPAFHGWIVREEPETPNPMTTIYNLPDPVIQDSSEPQPQLSVTLGLNFNGVDGLHAGGILPPDTNGSAGDKQFLLITNDAFEIFNKTTGKLEMGPLLINSLFKGFGGQCESDNGGDPIVLYDKMANRWLLEQLEYDSSYQICFAVSQTDDATGKYNLYSYTFSGLTDYPKLGIWPDAYYLAFNFFGAGHAEPCALDRKTMLAGGSSPAMVCFTPNTSDMGFLPSDLDGTLAPPKGEPNHYVELGNSNTTLKEYDFHVDFIHPKSSTFKGPNTLTVPAFREICVDDCIPQPPGGLILEALSDRLMFRNAYRNLGDHEAMVFSHTVGAGKNSTAISAERWYELRATPPGGSFAVYQAATYQNTTDNYWMGSVAMDKAGNIALGFSVDNNTSLDPSIWITGRVPGDPLNKMESNKIVHRGSGVQSSGDDRWGDYSSMSVDPTDDCTLWYTQEYSDGGSNWQSRIVSFKFSSCQ